MPREHKVRQRGKKKSKQQQEQAQPEADQDFQNEQQQQEQQQQPSWILSEQEFQQQQSHENGTGGAVGGAGGADTFDDSTPFGLVAPEIKSYFKTAHADLIAAAKSQHYAQHDEEGDTQQHSLLLNAALQELSGHELPMATDSDTSVVLEYMIRRINPIQLRIFADRFSGSLFTLATHRFGSHVVEAILAALQRLIPASQGTGSAVKSSASLVETSESSQGTLRSPTQLIIDYASELRQGGDEAVSTLLHHPFGTHVLRTLLSVLSGHENGDESDSKTRSKRSVAFRQKEDVSAKDKSREATRQEYSTVVVPDEFKDLLQDFISDLTAPLGVNEIRALSHNAVAAPTLGLLLKLEMPQPSDDDDIGIAGRLTDLLLDQIPTLCAKFQTSQTKKSKGSHSDADAWQLPPAPERSDHMESALRDPIASHLIQGALEAIARRAHAFPSDSSSHARVCAAGRLFWRTYILGRTVKLASHPSGNYVVQACLLLLGRNVSGEPNRADEQADELRAAIEEIRKSGKKLVKESTPDHQEEDSPKGRRPEDGPKGKAENRTGVLLTLLTRSGRLGAAGGYEAEAFHAVLASFGLGEEKTDGGEDDADESTASKGNKKQGKKAKKRKADDGQAMEAGGGDEEAVTEKSIAVDPDHFKALLVPCIMSLRTRSAYERQLSFTPGKKMHRKGREEKEEAEAKDQSAPNGTSEGRPETSVSLIGLKPRQYPGFLLLQAMLRMSPAIVEAVYASLLHPLNGTIMLRSLGESTAGALLLTSALGCGQASFKDRVALQKAVLEILPDLFKGPPAKFGSRVADACWDFADPFFKDKIGAKCLEIERMLLASEFGNFFLRRVNVGLYRRDPRKWKEEYLKGVKRKPLIPTLEQEWRQSCGEPGSMAGRRVHGVAPDKPQQILNGHARSADTDLKTADNGQKSEKRASRKRNREADTGDNNATKADKKVKKQKKKSKASSSLVAILNQIDD